MLAPALAVHEQVRLVLRDGPHELLAQHAHAVILLHDFVVAMVLWDNLFKGRVEAGADSSADPVQAEVHTKEVVAGLLCDASGQALFVPEHDGLFPEAESHSGARSRGW
ncbi:MAG: hypothetical protein M5R40_21735 [Anaerolineae bacterium]|nr:hypothetical protein [Anaerolineae bacterium]